MLAIIPARGGSKGLPGKNIKDLKGKPMIAYTIEAALKSEKISRVLVSTDSKEIEKVAKYYGAEVPYLRPASLSDDKASSLDVYRYVIDKIEQEQKNKIEEFMVLQPTSPLRNEVHIDEAINLYENKKADSVVSYCKEPHSIFWHKYIEGDGSFVEIFKDNFQKNRQEIRNTYYPNGAIYIFNRKVLETGRYYSERSYAYLMDRNVSIDIDDIEDFQYAEFLMSKK